MSSCAPTSEALYPLLCLEFPSSGQYPWFHPVYAFIWLCLFCFPYKIVDCLDTYREKPYPWGGENRLNRVSSTFFGKQRPDLTLSLPTVRIVLNPEPTCSLLSELTQRLSSAAERSDHRQRRRPAQNPPWTAGQKARDQRQVRNYPLPSPREKRKEGHVRKEGGKEIKGCQATDIQKGKPTGICEPRTLTEQEGNWTIQRGGCVQHPERTWDLPQLGARGGWEEEMIGMSVRKNKGGDFLAAQWLRLHLPLQGSMGLTHPWPGS